MSIGIYILNRNGRESLEQCLPSVLEAAAVSRYDCGVTVVDNDSTDDSLAWLAQAHPQVVAIRMPNRGRSSYNAVLAAADVRVAVLLNNDVQLAEDFIDLLVEPLLNPVDESADRCFMTVPQRQLLSGRSNQGRRAAVGWRWGLVQMTTLFAVNEQTRRQPEPTASAGPILAVDCREFLALGGFDSLFSTGKFEDLDFAFRGHQAGGLAQYVHTAIAYQRDQASFDREVATEHALLLTLRDTLLFQWKNLRHPWHVCRQIVGLSVRLAYSLLRAPTARRGCRLLIWRALFSAFSERRQLVGQRLTVAGLPREVQYFERFSSARMAQPAQIAAAMDADDERERRLAARHPISRWYVCPLANRLSRRLATSPVRAAHCTLAGLAFAILAGALVLTVPGVLLPLAALAVIAAWFCDRLDGPLARRQRASDPRGAWLDANIDELADLGLHVCVAARASQAAMSLWPWLCLVGFVCGKYLLVYGLTIDAAAGTPGEPSATTAVRGRLRQLYHLPGNADVRVHLLALALATGCLGLELALVAVYYNMRWMARYIAVVGRPTIAWTKRSAALRAASFTAAGSR